MKFDWLKVKAFFEAHRGKIGLAVGALGAGIAAGSGAADLVASVIKALFQ